VRYDADDADDADDRFGADHHDDHDDSNESHRDPSGNSDCGRSALDRLSVAIERYPQDFAGLSFRSCGLRLPDHP
jgi:hypothetical protein